MSLLVLLLGLTATGLILLRFELDRMPKRKRKQGTCLRSAFCLTLPVQTLPQLPFPEFVCSSRQNLRLGLTPLLALPACFVHQYQKLCFALAEFIASSLHTTASMPQTVAQVYAC